MDYIQDGTVLVPVIGYGDVDIQVTCNGERSSLTLYDVVYCEGFACSVVSLQMLQRELLWWDTKPPNLCIRIANNDLVADVTVRYDQYILEDSPNALKAPPASLTSHKPKPPSYADAVRWHLRLGHAGPDVIANLMENTTGVRVKGPRTVDCEACGLGKMRAQVGRAPKESDELPGRRWMIDFLDFEEDSEGYNRAMLFTERYSAYIFITFMGGKKGPELHEALANFLGMLNNQYNIIPQVIECDNELLAVDDIKSLRQTRRHRTGVPNAPGV